MKTIKDKDNDYLYDGSKGYDSQKCEKCGCRTALITGIFCYDPDDEPYNNDVKEKAKVESGECWVGGFKCDNCGHIQGLWSE
jgi:hypothetical protein